MMQYVLLYCYTTTLKEDNYLVPWCASASLECIIYGDPSFDRVIMLIESTKKLASALIAATDVYFSES
jgi:hypothetical protein